MRNTTKGYGLVLAGAVLCGTIGVFGKKVMDLEVDPLEMVAWRALFSFVLLAVAVLLFKRSLLRIRLADLPFFALFGLVGIGVNFVCFFYAIEFVPVAVATVLLYTYPFMVVLLASALLGERFTLLKGAALALSFAGCILVVNVFRAGGEPVDWRGILFGLANAAGVAVFTLMSKKAEKRYGPWTVMTYSLGFGTAALFIVLRPTDILVLRLPISGVLWLVALSAFSTVAGYVLFLFGLRYLQASKASVVATFEVVVAAVLAYFMFEQKMHPLQILGAALVVLAVIVIQKRERQHADIAEH